MKAISVKQMQELDKLTIENGGIPGKVLMEKAGTGAAKKILNFIRRYNKVHVKRFVLLAGKGNNGGDAYVIAKYLAEKTGIKTVIYSICKLADLKGDAEYHSSLLPSNVLVTEKNELVSEDFNKGDIIIDALLGTGFTGSLREPYGNWIETVNNAKLPVVSVDIPSGLNGDTGIVTDKAIAADYTVTMCLPKYGLLKTKGPEHCGIIDVVDIGTPQEFIDKAHSELLFFTEADAYKLINKVPVNSHKKSLGSVLIIGGSNLYPGAPFLAGKAALRAGAGFVTVAVPESMDSNSQKACSLVIRRINDEDKGNFTRASLKGLMELINTHDSVVLGPGISTSENCAEIVKEILKLDKQIVIDADALNIIAKYPSLITCNKKFIYTPHPGEAGRLLNGLKMDNLLSGDRIIQCEALAETLNGTVILKGNKTVVANSNCITSINSTGCQSLATAGSGDVLSGILAANYSLLANSFNAACLSVYIHGVTGDIGQSRFGMRGLIADDLIELIPKAIKKISPFA